MKKRFKLAIGTAALATILMPIRAHTATRIIFTGTITSIPANITQYSPGQVLSLEIGFNPNYSTDCNEINSSTTYLAINNIDDGSCGGPSSSPSLFENIKITSADGTFNNLAYLQSGSEESFEARAYSPSQPNLRNFIATGDYGGGSGLTISTINNGRSDFIGFTIPGKYIFNYQATPYFGAPPLSDPLLTPTSLISYYYNNSFYRDYSSLTNLGTPVENVVLKFGEGNVEFQLTGLDIISEVPGPLPLAGAAGAYGWSRKLRRRIRSS